MNHDCSNLSASEIVALSLESLPTSEAGIALRAKTEEWVFSFEKGKGGKGGQKKVYRLPEYALAELNKKSQGESIDTVAIIKSNTLKEPKSSYIVNNSNSSLCSTYNEWEKGIDYSRFVAIRYYPDLRASAGNGAINYEHHECRPLLFANEFIHQELKVNPKYIICIPIVGDSMEPTIMSGGMAMVDTSKKYDGEGIYLIRQGEGLKIKRLQQIAYDKMLVISDNREVYSTIEVDLSLVEEYEFDILGKYLWDSRIAK